MRLRESFSIPYGGGELWCSNLDGLKTDNTIILNRILSDEKLICRPSTSSVIIYHLYDTEITYELAEALVNSFIRAERHIKKLAVIGLSKNGKQNIKRYLNNSNLQFNIVMKYFDDFELAKEWLVSEKA